MGETTTVRQPVQATDELGRYISPQGEIVATTKILPIIWWKLYPLYLDEGELTFYLDGQVVSPITNVGYTGNLIDLTLDFSNSTQFDQPFSTLT